MERSFSISKNKFSNLNVSVAFKTKIFLKMRIRHVCELSILTKSVLVLLRCTKLIIISVKGVSNIEHQLDFDEQSCHVLIYQSGFYKM